MKLKEIIFGALPVIPAIYLSKKIPEELLVKFSDDPNLLSTAVSFLLATIGCKILRRQILWALLKYQGYVTQPKSIITKIWGLGLKIFNYASPKLFSYEDLLPKLPLPSVSHTIELMSAVQIPTIMKNSGPERVELYKKACITGLKSSYIW